MIQFDGHIFSDGLKPPSSCTWLGSPPFISRLNTFGRGPTTPQIGDLGSKMVINNLLSGMIRQEEGVQSKHLPSLKLIAKAPENWGPLGKGDSYWKPPFLRANC